MTKFFAVSGLPLVPLTSYYFAGFGETKSEGIPLLFYSQSTAIYGLPLARVDRLSALVAYFRGICGGLILFGCMAIVPLIMKLTGEHLDDLAVIFFRVLVSCLATGVLLGCLSYLMPFQTSRRERNIRQLCGDFIGVCADPAIVRADVAQNLVESSPHSHETHPSAFATLSNDERRWSLLKDLVQVRVKISRLENADRDRQVLEGQTDDLLHRLENMA